MTFTKTSKACTSLWRHLLAAVICFAGTSGCDETDKHRQVAEVAREAADRQAQQNNEMARMNREVTEGTRRLIEADAQARQETMEVHHEIQAERVSLQTGFDQLETERKRIAQQRRTESMVVPAVQSGGSILLGISVVLFCLVLLVGFRQTENSDAELNELLLVDLAREQPRLLAAPEGRPDDSPDALPDSRVEARLTHQPNTSSLNPAEQGRGDATPTGETT